MIEYSGLWGFQTTKLAKYPDTSLIFSPKHVSLTVSLLILASFEIWIGWEFFRSPGAGSFLSSTLSLSLYLSLYSLHWVARRNQAATCCCIFPICCETSSAKYQSVFLVQPILGFCKLFSSFNMRSSVVCYPQVTSLTNTIKACFTISWLYLSS